MFDACIYYRYIYTTIKGKRNMYICMYMCHPNTFGLIVVIVFVVHAIK